MRQIFATIVNRGIIFCITVYCVTGFAITSSANTYNVTNTADGHATNQLRGAIEAADALGGTHTINVAAGTYNLTLGQISFGNGAQNITITGAGSGSTIINMTGTNQDRIFIINPPGTIPDITTTISGIKFSNGRLTSDDYGGGAIICGGPNNYITINNCVFDNNGINSTVSSGGGAIYMAGGGYMSVDNCTFSNNFTYGLNGGAIDCFFDEVANLSGSISVTNSTFTANHVYTSPFAIGGAITVVTRSPAANQSFSTNISKNSFINNTVADNGANQDGGGAIYIVTGFNANINYNRFSGNKRGTTSDALYVEKSLNGPVDATNNWWGCNDDPMAASACVEVARLVGTIGATTLTTSPRLQLKTTAGLSTLCQGGTTITLVTASFLTNSANGAVSTANLARLIGVPVSFSATNGSLSGAQSSIQSNGNATVTFNGNAGTGASSVNAVVDNLPNTDATAKASITVGNMPSMVSQPFNVTTCSGSTVAFSVGVSSSITPAYQWYKGTTPLNNGATGTGSTISGVTTSGIFITNPGNADVASNYKCVATTGCGVATSNNAALAIYGSRLYFASGSSGTGSSWADALGNLNTALNIASSCSSVTEIWVKAGTYRPSSKPFNTLTVLNQDNAFILVNGVTIYGGFAGTETAVSQRNINTNPTILSGDIGTLNDASDNCFHVVVSVNNNSTAVLDGFTITGGNTNNAYSAATFAGTSVSRAAGGGLAIVNSSPKIINCTITGNASATGGGGLYQSGAIVIVSKCVFSNNTAQYGGAVRTENTPTFTAVNCVFSGNTASNSGAAMSLYQGKDTLANNLFIKNKDNGSAQGGGAVCVSTGDFYIANNTFYADTTNGKGGAVRSESVSGTLKLYNNIFYKNYAALGNTDVDNVTSPGYTATNNSFSATNPVFANEADLDGADNTWGTTDDGLNLLGTSTGMDAGDNSKIPAGVTTDIAGRTRIQNGVVDLGAYENGTYNYSTIYVDSSVAAAGDGGTWATALKTMSDAIKLAKQFSNINTIYAAKGTYYPTGSQNGTNRDSTFLILRGGLKIYGGYPSGGGTRNVGANPTILSGDIGTANNMNDNSYHVMVIVSLAAGADSLVVDGLAIANGNASAGGGFTYGTVNMYQGNGGGVYLINNANGNKMRFNNVIFNNNKAVNAGGGFDINNSAPIVSNCAFTNNSSNNAGGGLFNEVSAQTVVVNCVFTANTCGNGGGAMYNSFCQPVIVNCTIYANTAATAGGIFSNGSTGSISNCIIWGNTGINPGLYVANAAPSLISDLIQGGNAGIAPSDPLFLNTANPAGPDNIWGTDDDGLHIQLASPAFDAGNNSAVPAYITTDITGSARISNVVNAGAYEKAVYNYSTLYVDSSAAAAGDGGTWATALQTMSDALKLAKIYSNINTIYAAKGTYYPTGSQSGTNRDSTFLLLRGGLKIYGGYPSGGGTRNIGANPTILSGDIGAANNNTDNSYHVMVIVGLAADADSLVVDGVTIANGTASAEGGFTYGTVNMYQGNGGGVYLINNNNNVNGNKLVFNKVIFSNNSSINAAGAFDANNSSPLISNCVFTGNTANNMGGALFTETFGNPLVVNTVFTGNHSNNGGAVYNYFASVPTFLNCTMYGNTATVNGGAAYDNDAGISMNNCVIWGNPSPGVNIFNAPLPGGIITNLVENGVYGATTGDPRFMNTANLAGPDNIWGTDDDGLHILPASPAYDGGDNSAVPAFLTTDITGSARIDNIVNMGAYEKTVYNYTTIYVDSSKAVAGDGGSWGTALKTLSDALKIAQNVPTVNTILVAKGTYYPTGSQSGTNRDSAFAILRGGLKLYGGYPSGGGNRNPNNNPTSLDGNINTAGSGDNSYHVMVIAGIGAAEDSVIVDGFTIRNGAATGGSKVYNGNTVDGTFGGAVHLLNVANTNRTIFRRCLFTNNNAITGGGALYQLDAWTYVYDCVFLNNSALYGGAVRGDLGSRLSLYNSAFVSNTSQQSGAAMSLYSSRDTIVNNIFVKNLDNGTAQGGGAMCINNGVFWIENNTFYADSTRGKGGAIDAESTSGRLYVFNNIFYKNYSPSGNSDLDNSMIGPQIVNNSFGTDPLFTNENILAGNDGLWATDDDGLRLKPNSPAINAGDNSKLRPNMTFDINGDDRIQGGTVDLGAYERKPVILTATMRGDTMVCQNTPATRILLTGGGGGIKPYTFTYTINNGGNHTAVTVTGDTVSFEAPTDMPGKYVYTVVTIRDKTGNMQTINTSVTVVVKQNPTARLTAPRTQLCYNAHVTAQISLMKNGTAPYKYSFDNGSTYQDSAKLNTGPGTYIGVIKDSAGCMATMAPLTITQADTMMETIVPIPITCGNTNLQAIVTGGYPNRLYSLDGGTYQAGNTFINVGLGTHSVQVKVKDAAGCIYTAHTVTITQPAAPLVINETHTNVSCLGGNDGSITAGATGGYGNYTFGINGGQFTPGNVFNNQPAGSPKIYVMDAFGCINNKKVTITQPATPCFSMSTDAPVDKAATGKLKLSIKAYPNPSPNAFTLTLEGGDETAPAELRVVDVNGKAIYQTRGSIHNAFTFGQTFASGIYIAEVFNGKNAASVKLVKVK